MDILPFLSLVPRWQQGLHVVLCGKPRPQLGAASANGLAGRCLSLDMRR
jgi:hypothetical protein